MPEYYWGEEWKRRWWRRHGKPVTVDLAKDPHGGLIGPPGCGKGVTNEIVNLLAGKGALGEGLCDCNVISLDTTGQNYGVTHRWRSEFSDIVRLNWFNLLGFGDDGFNPMLFSEEHDEQAALGQCLQYVSGQEREPLWSEGAQDFYIGSVSLEIYEAKKENRTPTLENVYGNICGDYTATAKRMFETGIYELATAGGGFLEKNRTNDGIIKTAVTSGRWLRNEAIRKSLSVPKSKGFDPMRLITGDRPVTVYAMLDADKVAGPYAGVLKLVAVSVLNVMFRFGTQRKRDTVIMLSEAAAIGNLPKIKDALAQGRKYGIRICPMVWQDSGQITTVFGKEGKTTVLGNSGSLLGFCPAPLDLDTADLLASQLGEILGVNESTSEDIQGGNLKRNVREERQRLWTSDEVGSLPRFHGLVWKSNKAAPVPVACPPYWKIPELKGRYDPDPYPHSSPAPATSRRKVIAMAAALAAVIGGGLRLSNAAGSGPTWRDDKPVVRVDPPKANPPAHGSPRKPPHVTRR